MGSRCPRPRRGRALGATLASVLAAAPAAAMPRVGSPSFVPPELDWPPVTRTCRPWTYWWWMGSAVRREELTRHLEAYRKAGMGGVHIVPIYAAKGWEDRSIPFLSAEWVRMLRHAASEARRLDMGLDMSTGTGWPFGGPWVGPGDAAARVLFETYRAGGRRFAPDRTCPAPRDSVRGRRLDGPIRSREQPDAALAALVAFPEEGDPVDLTGRVDASRHLDWIAPPGTWTLYAAFQGRTGQRVKRAAPGGEGNVLDPFSAPKLARYLARFDEAFGPAGTAPVRAFYNDSFEVYRANWTDDLLEQFARRRGYDLRLHLPALLGRASGDEVRRVRYDYRRTIADLLREAYTIPWVEWAHRKGARARNQAHGAPANILDLYAAADIPETESYGPDWLRASGLAVPAGIPAGFGGGAEILACRFASSAAHVAGRPLVSCESCTWLSEHFRVSLAQVKAELDLLFTAGVNHVFFHGMTYSPAEAGWPGWLFYAATNFGPSNPFWRDLPALNAYIARCQSFLQLGRPDPDVLLYFPIHDLWSREHGATNLLHYLQVHNTEAWLRRNLATFYEAAKRLRDRGYAFDLVSDRLLREKVRAENGGLASAGASYRALLLAGCTVIPPETLQAVLALARRGAQVLVLGELPRDVPGLADLDARRRRLREAIAALRPAASPAPGPRRIDAGKGRLLIGDDLEGLLASAGVRREPIADAGVRFVRRIHERGWDYFLSQPGPRRLDGWVRLAVDARSAVLFDPYAGTRGVAALARDADGTARVYLQLDPGESRILRALRDPVDGPRWRYLAAAGPAHPIAGTWDVRFLEGGPARPGPFRTEKLASWAGSGGIRGDFSGTARYAIAFRGPARRADEWILDLGRVRESARVRLDGRPLGVLVAPPFRIPIGAALREGENRLEIEVTNLMANRIAAMDREGIPWRRYFFVFMTGVRDAAGWAALPSGLLGPVKLLPMRALVPPPPATAGGRPVAHWTFEGGGGRKALDGAGGVEDAIRGNFARVGGVRGRGLRFDGYTTRVVREARRAPHLAGAFTIGAWIALQTYPWNRTAIVDRHAAPSRGYFFGIDAGGHLAFGVGVGGTWHACASRARVPLLAWSHAAATFDGKHGIAIYLNGKPVGSAPVRGSLDEAADADLWIGTSHRKMAPARTEREPSRRILSPMVLDGRLDEIAIWDRALGAREIARVHAAFDRSRPEPLARRVLPSGPAGTFPFGAYYTYLKYSDAWDALWRGGGPDIVVAFDAAPIRLVSWRGVSYAPCWVTEKGFWFSHEFLERSSPLGCAESMGDKHARFSSARIIESHEARAVIGWRYSPVDIGYGQPHVDPETGWGDWAEERYTVYPDGVAAREVVMWSSRLDAWHEWCQSLPIFQPGQRPEDVLDAEGLLSLANLAGQSRAYTWPWDAKYTRRGHVDPDVPGANIQVVHYRCRFKPFLILPDANPRIWFAPFRERRPGRPIRGMSMPLGSRFWWWNHWPVAQLPNDGRIAEAPDRPSHSYTSTQDCDPYARTAHSMTKIMLCGLTEKSAADLVPLARSWCRPPRLRVTSGPFESKGYDPAQRAYVLAARGRGPRRALAFEIAASPDAPLVHPAFVLEGWGEAGVRLAVRGEAVRLRYGHRRTLRGTDLVVWVEVEATEPVPISLEHTD